MVHMHSLKLIFKVVFYIIYFQFIAFIYLRRMGSVVTDIQHWLGKEVGYHGNTAQARTGAALGTKPAHVMEGLG